MSGERNNKKVINSWAMYDWANSVYSLVITSATFPIYYNAITTHDADDHVTFFGIPFINTALYSYALSFSFLLVCLLSPVLSSIADYRGNKKSFLKAFCLLGSCSCAALFFFTSQNLEYGIIIVILASVGFWGSIVFYNAYLPEIVTPDMTDKVSAKGFSMGYLGSSILLILCLAIILGHEGLGIDEGLATRITFVITGIWWFGFAQITFRRLPDSIRAGSEKRHLITHGFAELRKVWNQASESPSLKRFLVSFFFYSMGVQTVMLMATSFGDKLLKLETAQLIATILIIQFVAIAGSHLFAWISGKWGNRQGLAIAVGVWIGICISAWFVGTHKSVNGFYILAFVVGMVMGGIQSLSRATYSKLLPETEDHASFFSFYDVTEKLSIVIGTFSYGLIESLTGSMVNSVIALMAFFVIGMAVLFPLKDAKLKPINA